MQKLTSQIINVCQKCKEREIRKGGDVRGVGETLDLASSLSQSILGQFPGVGINSVRPEGAEP